MCLLLAMPMLFLPFSPDKISDFFYRELTYNRIADLHSKNSRQDTIVSVFKYVSNNLTSSKKYNVVDKNSFTDLVRGVGWCDQQAFVLMNLLNKSDISETRLRDVQAHTYSEVFIDDRWVIVDPYFGFFPVDSNGDLLGLGDLKNVEITTSIINNSHNQEGNFIKEIDKIYIKNEIRWSNGVGPEFVNYRAYDLYRGMLSYYANYVYRLFGSGYFNWTQDIYLKSDKVTNMNDKGRDWIRNYSDSYKDNKHAFQLFYKARNYHIVDRFELSSDLYREVVQQYPESYWAIESKLYLNN